jgi:site-specific recombinase XerC
LERPSSDTPYAFDPDGGDGRTVAAAESVSNLAQAVESFLFHCRFEKNLSPKTLNAYELDLRQFSASLTAGARIHPATLRDAGGKEHQAEGSHAEGVLSLS